MWVFLCMYLVVDWLLVIAVVALLEDATVRAECGWEGAGAGAGWEVVSPLSGDVASADVAMPEDWPGAAHGNVAAEDVVAAGDVVAAEDVVAAGDVVAAEDVVAAGEVVAAEDVVAGPVAAAGSVNIGTEQTAAPVDTVACHPAPQ